MKNLEEHTLIMDELLKFLGCRNDNEFLSELKRVGKINQSQVSRWRNQGFSGSTGILLKRILMEIETIKKDV